ncbi:MAG: transporter [Nitrospirae bacterium CG_4_9_14_3_um_filter_53_35]|nr:MAG: transporter [Nitrospirae bacterium CG08_land_8_20_14_0_20_52_24]PIV84003.1 MAG: transporter [Nitrospirae bacterium CG17_big_fil_post_rev_8_21_14_2_50_50_9]PIW84907.1 MAG: transporter [Nitrospirae bacterium CG_4_8_14_3_um_filter_50_41]PIX85933.1 MAG: transporter [Nitrospirae bacterium CG_4_10_14_3_um_filter_53_41]PJA73097.1 MAG: transporter [Nitrospirae bacterium CG_4_9_14_3_um_filter_53_35]
MVIFLWSETAFASHPLITDDTDTQGKGKFQLEVNGEYAHEDEDGVTENATEIATMLSYGIADNIDIVLGIPYQDMRTKDPGTTSGESGIADTSLEFKWRFYEKDGLGFALKPGMTMPTGDDGKGLGAGKATYSLFFITTRELNPWAFHLNLGYRRNENKVDERNDIWHTSLAAEVEVMKDLKVVGNIGIERNPDKTSNTHPAFILGGLIYSISKSIAIDAGVKGGLNKPDTDLTLLAGITFRF